MRVVSFADGFETSSAPTAGQGYAGPDGTEALPAWSFSGDTDTGYYRIGANNLGLSLGGTKYADWSTSGLLLSLPLQNRHDQNSAFRSYVRNDSSGTSAQAKFSLITETDDVDFFATSLLYTGANASAGITVGSLFTGGFSISLGGARTFSLATNGANRLRADGSGNVVIGAAAISTSATNGFLYIPTCAGAATGSPTAYTGIAPMVLDTTNNRIYFHNGSAWKYAALT